MITVVRPLAVFDPGFCDTGTPQVAQYRLQRISENIIHAFIVSGPYCATATSARIPRGDGTSKSLQDVHRCAHGVVTTSHRVGDS
jgi:hypothetical protein